MGKSVFEAADTVFGSRVQGLLDMIGDDLSDKHLARLTVIVKETRETMMKLVAELMCADLAPVVMSQKIHHACRRGFEHVYEYAYLIDDEGLLPLERNTDIDVLKKAKGDRLGFEDLEKGMLVCYCTDHGTSEVGRVKGWNEKYVFVVYQCDGNWDNYENYTGCATNIRDLEKVQVQG